MPPNYASSIASLPDYPGLYESLSFLFHGFGIVILTLSILALITYGIGRLFVVISKSPKADQAVNQTSEPVGKEIDGRVLAAIAAAVHTVCGRHARLTHVKRIGTEQRWAQEGRQSLLSSHNPRNPTGRGQTPFNRKNNP